MMDKITVLEQPFIDKAIKLAEAVKAFKTPEMENAFAQFLIIAMKPPMIFEPKESNHD